VVLLLDEPTNHLDDAAAVFLEEQLRSLPGVVVLASHDRAFLDAVCTDLIDLDPAVDGPTRYGGNYTDYQARKRAERERWQRRFTEEQNELASTSPDGILVSLRDVRVPGRLGLDRLDVSANERLLVTGANGAGKSTLLALLAGRLEASGEVRRRRGLTVGLLAQDTVFDRPDRTVRETYELALGAERAESVPLSTLGLIGPQDLARPVGDLSVGQRRRLALALLVAEPPELLLLDEPTNHLSPRLADELEEALGTGPGAIVVASHDRWLRSRWPGHEIQLGMS
jgi:ATPase subunit of ABC transporter with duplicated ATPase domains